MLLYKKELTAIIFLTILTFVKVAKIVDVLQLRDNDWWKRAVIYQIYPLSFKDSNNDGIGDINGITSKLEYLADTGVTAVWISSLYKSPHVDQGDDITDFLDIDERFGTLADFDAMVARARELGIKIIMDFIPNHSSDQHEWFQRSLRREPEFEDLYVWKDAVLGEPTNNWLSVYKNSAWEWHLTRRQHYLHHFSKWQPDFNYRNPLVMQNMQDVLEFWLDRGVDGFAVIGAQYLYENDNFDDEPSKNNNIPENEHGSLDHIHTSDQDETYDIIYQWREFLDVYTASQGGDPRILITEAYTTVEKTIRYFGNSDREGAHVAMNPQFLGIEIDQNLEASHLHSAITEWISSISETHTSSWVLGNRNYHRIATRFGTNNIDGLNMLAAFLPGILITYNGEEIGQENGEINWNEGKDPSACEGSRQDFERTSRDFQRTPFHWDDTINAGFNEGAQPWLPVSEKYLETNLKAQSDPNVLSHYQVYKQMVELRRDPILIDGDVDVRVSSQYVLSCTRSLEPDRKYFLLFNVGDQNESLDLREEYGIDSNSVRVVVASSNSVRKTGDIIDPLNVELLGHECVIVEPSDEIILTTTPPTTTSGEINTVSTPGPTDPQGPTDPPGPTNPPGPPNPPPTPEDDGGGVIRNTVSTTVLFFLSLYYIFIMY